LNRARNLFGSPRFSVRPAWALTRRCKSDTGANGKGVHREVESKGSRQSELWRVSLNLLKKSWSLSSIKRRVQ